MPRQQAVGLILAALLILGGRGIRTRILLDDQGNWKNRLWLDELILPQETSAAESRQPKPQLTDPLPINTCSQDSLTLLPGVGKVMAGRIMEARGRGLAFSCRDDLRLIKGIGEKLSARLDTLVDYGPRASKDSLKPDS